MKNPPASSGRLRPPLRREHHGILRDQHEVIKESTRKQSQLSTHPHGSGAVCCRPDSGKTLVRSSTRTLMVYSSSLTMKHNVICQDTLMEHHHTDSVATGRSTVRCLRSPTAPGNRCTLTAKTCRDGRLHKHTSEYLRYSWFAACNMSGSNSGATQQPNIRLWDCKPAVDTTPPETRNGSAASWD